MMIISGAVAHDGSDVLDQTISKYAHVENPPQLKPNRVAAKEYVVGRDLASRGFHREAVAHYLHAAELDDTSPSPWAAMAKSLEAIGRPEAAFNATLASLQRDPTNSTALLVIGLDAAMSGEYQESVRLLSRLRLQGNNLPIDTLIRDVALATALQEIGDVEISELLRSSENDLLEAALIQLLRADQPPWLHVMQQLIDVGNPKAALHLAQLAAPKLNPQQLATILSAMPVIEIAANGSGEVTLATYEAVGKGGLIPLRPKWHEPKSLAIALSTAAQSMSTVGAIDAPIILYKVSLTHDPTELVAINNYSWLLLQRDGATKQAVSYAQLAYETDPNAGFVLDTIGFAKFLQGEFSEAIDFYIEALNVSGEDSLILDHLGDAFWQANQRRDAVGAWQKSYRILRSTDHYQAEVEGYEGMIYSVWGISISTPEALYDLELGSVMRRLQQKLTAVKEGKNPLETKKLSDIKPHGVR